MKLSREDREILLKELTQMIKRMVVANAEEKLRDALKFLEDVNPDSEYDVKYQIKFTGSDIIRIIAKAKGEEVFTIHVPF